MSGIEDLRVAEPVEIIEAWRCGVMHMEGDHRAARNLVAAYPVPEEIDDPTFGTPDGPDRTWVWHRAREISNPAAMLDMQKYLHARGLCLPPEVMHAWARTTERLQWVQEITTFVEQAVRDYLETAETLTDLWAVVSEVVARKAQLLVDARDE
jgi:hypothetical protein